MHAVADGEAAAIHQNPAPDLLLTDIMMPRLDGFGLLQAIRAPATSGLLVVLLSARAGEEARVEDLPLAPMAIWSNLSRHASSWRAHRWRRAHGEAACDFAARELDLQAMVLAQRARIDLSEVHARMQALDEKYQLLMARARAAIMVLGPDDIAAGETRIPRPKPCLTRPRAEILGHLLQDFLGVGQVQDVARLLNGDGLDVTELRPDPRRRQGPRRRGLGNQGSH